MGRQIKIESGKIHRYDKIDVVRHRTPADQVPRLEKGGQSRRDICESHDRQLIRSGHESHARLGQRLATKPAQNNVRASLTQRAHQRDAVAFSAGFAA